MSQIATVLTSQRSCTRIFRPIEYAEQQIEQGVAFAARNPLDPVGEVRIDVENLLARDRMGAHHRMNRRQVFSAGLGVELGAVGQLFEIGRPAAVLEAVDGLGNSTACFMAAGSKS